MTILRGGKAVDDFVEGAVAAASYDELAMIDGGLLGDFCGMTGAGGFRKFGVDARGSEDAASFVEHATPASAATTGVGIVDEQSVFEFRVGHLY